MARNCIVLLPLLALVACTHDPIEYIPATDRALLQAQARVDGGGAPQGAVSVDQMLARARTAADAAKSKPPAIKSVEPLVLQFAVGAVMPDAQQKQSIASFAAAAKGQRVTVISRPGDAKGDAVLLGQRRAMAVARALQPGVNDIDLRFTADAPPDVVVISLEAGGERRTTP